MGDVDRIISLDAESSGDSEKFVSFVISGLSYRNGISSTRKIRRVQKPRSSKVSQLFIGLRENTRTHLSQNHK